MNVLYGFLIAAIVTTFCVTTMLLVRRRAPEGSWFADGDRASGVFGVLATGFSVLLGFIIFLSFESYDASRAGAEAEAITVVQQIETAQFMAPDTANELTGELVCYARTVVGPEWESLNDGTLGDAINPWAAEMFRTMQAVEPKTASQQSAYDRWMDQTLQREQARSDRLHGVEGIIPTPLWIVLFVVAGVIFFFMLFFADRAESIVTQGMLMGSVALVITLLLLLLNFFDNPHGEGVGRLQPTAMERTVRLIDIELEAAGIKVSPPCDAQGITTA